MGGDTADEGKIAPVASKTKKRKLTMDPMVESSWLSKKYSTPVEETVLLVGKSTGMPSTTSGGFTPQIVGVDQMKWKPHHGTRTKGTQEYEYG